MGSSRPGKFPATVLAVSGELVVLSASAEDTEYLKAEVGKNVVAEITPAHSPAPEPDAGSVAST